MATYLNVPYSEKDLAKRLGARWDHSLGQWYVPINVLLDPFSHWLPKIDGIEPKKKKKSKKQQQKVNTKSFGVTIGADFPKEKESDLPPWE